MHVAEIAQQDAVLQVPREAYRQMQCRLESDRHEIEQLKAQLDWFKRQIFGAKSEQRHVSAEQIALFQAQLAAAQGDGAPTIKVPAHERQKRRTGAPAQRRRGQRHRPSVRPRGCGGNIRQ